MKLKTIIEKFQNYKNIEEFLNKKTKKYEPLETALRILVGFRCIKKLEKWKLTTGNYNKNTIKKGNLEKYLKRDLKDKGDKSDLTLIRKNTLLLTTCKNWKKINIGEFDIRDINSIFQDKYKNFYNTYVLCICLRKKEDFDNILKNIEKSSEDIKKIIKIHHTIVIDQEDLEQGFKLFKNTNKQKFEQKHSKKNIRLKFHQQLSVSKTINYLKKNYTKILWGHIPRSGKSYIMAGVIIEMCKFKKQLNILIITTAPNETIKQYVKMFKSYEEFNNFKIITNYDKYNIENVNNIFIFSKQKLQNKSIPFLNNIDIRFFDESHNGGTTDISKDILKNYGKKDCPTCFITATYLKPKQEFNTEKELFWDQEDIILSKELNFVKLEEKHGKIVRKIRENYTDREIQEEYEKCPRIEILNLEFRDKKTLEDLKKNNYEGISIQSILSLDVKSEKFQDEEKVKQLLFNIFGKKKKLSDEISIKTSETRRNIMRRIELFQRSSKFSSRQFSYENPLIIMCFLPVGLENSPINELSKNLEKLIEKEDLLPDYEIISINGKITKTPKEDIKEGLTKAKNKNKKGLIVFSGKQCSLGVSLKKCDVVILMNNITSYDIIFQMMYRCMTESKNKKLGFVVDLNFYRSINMVVDIGMKLGAKNSKEAFKLVIEQNFIGINSDLFFNKTFGFVLDKTNYINRLHKIYTSQPINYVDKLITNIHSLSIEISDIEEEQIKTAFFIERKTNKNKIIEIDEKGEKIPNGLEIKKIESIKNKKKDEKSEKIEKDEKHINIMKDIICHIIPLICILTIHDKIFDISSMIIKIKEKLFDLFICQLRSYWGNKIDNEIIDLIIKIMKRSEKNTIFNNSVLQLKELFYENKYDKHKISELIDKYLIPQELEKKKNAEISTPYKLRQEMIDKLEEYKSNFFKKKRTVFEPCSGKGGFLIDIIDRFMKGLKDKIKNEKERYKFIVEECLYFSDIK